LPERTSLHTDGKMISVVAVVEHWLASPLVRVEMGIRLKMKAFAVSVADSADSTDQMVTSANGIVETLNRWVFDPFSFLVGSLTDGNFQITSQDRLQPTPTRSYASGSKPKSPGGFANALMALEGKQYNRLLPTDYIVHFLHPSTEGSIADARKTNGMISDWVKKSILIREDYEDRAKVFTFFANTAVVGFRPFDH
jgi:hypothetical protein